MPTIKDITNKFQEVYYLPDPTPLRMVIATTLSPYMEGSPVWLMIVASSGSGKTELIKCLSAIEKCYFISNMTENTLLSGSRAPNKQSVDEDGKKKSLSLLHRIPKYGAVFIWPEFNTLLDERSEKKAAILSQLRSVYDGNLTKITGLGDELKWEGKVALVGACTEKYFTDMEQLDAAGPRFTIYALPELNDAESKERLTKVKKNEHLFEKTQHEIQHMVKEFYDKKVYEGIPAYLEVPQEFDEIINKIAGMLGVALTSVIHNFRGIITDVYGKPDGTRFYRAGRKLAQSMMVLEEDQQLIESDQKAIIKMMFDTIPRRRHRVLSVLSRFEEANTKGLSHMLHLPTETVREILQELNAINMVSRRSGSSPLEGDIWTIKPQYKEIFNAYEDGSEYLGGKVIETTDDGSTESVFTPRLYTFSDDPVHEEEVRKNESMKLDQDYADW